MTARSRYLAIAFGLEETGLISNALRPATSPALASSISFSSAGRKRLCVSALKSGASGNSPRCFEDRAGLPDHARFVERGRPVEWPAESDEPIRTRLIVRLIRPAKTGPPEKQRSVRVAENALMRRAAMRAFRRFNLALHYLSVRP